MDETKGTTETDALPPAEQPEEDAKSLSFWVPRIALLFTCIMMLVSISRHLNDVEVIAKSREIITSQAHLIESLMRENEGLLRHQQPPVLVSFNTVALAKLTEANENLRVLLKIAEGKNEWLNRQVSENDYYQNSYLQMLKKAYSREDEWKARAEKAERGCYAITPQGTWPGVVLTPVAMPSAPICAGAMTESSCVTLTTH